ncbi:hypothetical protein PXC01_05690 [Maribacter sp. M208]|uniref:hypothetical protein n=1 Tax=Maribacter huludaoensis TaxID=3030010 RepID=UPI0023ED1F5B|nr:hypothetical protein [Maribacter huludaoensis]MDF4221071.1 hypothetical protein [Maribacter huludaoensis]
MGQPKKLSNQDSLDLITKMIEQARANIETKTGPSMLLIWGYTTVIVGLIIGILGYMNIWSYRSFLWFLIPLICYPRIVKYVKQKNVIPSYIDISVNNISLLYIVICTTVAVASTWIEFPVFFIEGLLISMWSFTLGVLVKFKKVMIGGIFGIILSHIFLLLGNSDFNIFLFLIIIAFTIIIPGHVFSKLQSSRKESYEKT